MVPWASPEFDSHEHVCAFFDPRSGLRAIVAMHSLALGPAAGGTRFWPYPSDDLALADALRLSRAMSYKCALAGVPLGGGKATIIGDPRKDKNEALLKTYGHFLNRIGNQFSTGEDVGMSVADCEIIRTVSPFVAGTRSSGAGDPSLHAALGVFYGIRAVLECHFNRDDYDGVRFAVQGVGNVGMKLCRLLHEAGADLTVSDIASENAKECSERFSARVVDPDVIHAVNADVFVPCALGGVINARTVGSIRARAIAGAANNQLESAAVGAQLHSRGILFAPDYVINAGGLIGAAEELARMPGRNFSISGTIEVRLQRIHDRLIEIFDLAESTRETPELTAERMARDILCANQASIRPDFTCTRK